MKKDLILGHGRDPDKDFADWAFFDTLKEIEEIEEIEEIVIIGHSLSPVDHPYFRKIIERNEVPNEIRWKITYTLSCPFGNLL